MPSSHQHIGRNGKIKSRADDVAADFEDLRTDVAKLALELGKVARAQASSAQHRVEDFGHTLRDRADDSVDYLGDQVKARPLAALGVTVGVGILLGLALKATSR